MRLPSGEITSRIFLSLTVGVALSVSSLGALSANGSSSKPAPAAARTVERVVWREPDTKPRAVVLCLHGLGLHKGTFEAFGKRLAKAGFVVYAIDMRGFGSWLEKSTRSKIDFNGCLSDIHSTISSIQKEYPGLPVFLLGESMGGAIALRATALYPNQVAGLISSVPSGDRFKAGSQRLKVALHAITEGLNKPMSVSNIVEQATEKQDLRSTWRNDPAAKLQLTPMELIAFDHFMDDNYIFAGKVTNTPVLFMQGCKDKLVRPAGTWDLFDHLKTPDRERVFSTTAEHLIFEEGQFSNDDFGYLLSWIDKVVAGKPGAAHPQPDSHLVAGQSQSQPEIATQTAPPSVKPPVQESPMSLDYWIELHRKDKTFRCNNKTDFVSGDAIRFHFVPHTDGYAYILMTAGTKGDRAILFPSTTGGLDNFLKAGSDYILPSAAWLWFDENPGTERVSLVFSKQPIDAQAYLNRASSLIAFVSSDRTGSKDIVPTRMELSWDDPAPVIMPEQIQAASGSTVKIRQRDSVGTLALEISLEHR
jgi:alpha-beta hydrolase superfamily lysophospholipase